MTISSNNSSLVPALKALPFQIKMYTENNPRKTVDGKVASLFCIFCSKKIRREEKFEQLSGNSIKDSNATTCSSTCFEPIKEVFLEGRVQLPPDTLEALFYNSKNTANATPKEEPETASSKLYPAYFPLYLENNPSQIINHQKIRKYCIYCAKEIQRKGGNFDTVCKNPEKNRISMASMTASACEECCLKVSYVFFQDFVHLPKTSEKEIFI